MKLKVFRFKLEGDIMSKMTIAPNLVEASQNVLALYPERVLTEIVESYPLEVPVNATLRYFPTPAGGSE